MIARIWKGTVDKEHGDKYLDYVIRTGVKEQRATPGNQGSWVLRRLTNGGEEFVVMSLWDSMDSIREFAGPAVNKAVYYPEDDQFLHEKAEEVTHYEVGHQG